MLNLFLWVQFYKTRNFTDSGFLLESLGYNGYANTIRQFGSVK